ncbi:MAG TPA: hypothetical protein VIG62_20500 [Blastocatellia bacterium]|jgi:hypothetical protein
MIKKRATITTAFLVLLSLVFPAYGQQQAAQPTPRPEPAYVDHKEFKGRIFEIKHREPRLLANLVSSLGSGFKGAVIQSNDEFRTITVRDFPENITAIEEALKRYDTPQPLQSDVEFKINVLIASNQAGMSSQYPQDIADVVKQLQSAFDYKSYTNIATMSQRVREGVYNANGNGRTDLPAATFGATQPQSHPADLEYAIQGMSINPESGGNVSFHIRQFNLRLIAGPVGRASIGTGLTIRNGEKVVVGTTTLGNNGLIVVLTARAAR